MVTQMAGKEDPDPELELRMPFSSHCPAGLASGLDSDDITALQNSMILSDVI